MDAYTTGRSGDRRWRWPILLTASVAVLATFLGIGWLVWDASSRTNFLSPRPEAIRVTTTAQRRHLGGGSAPGIAAPAGADGCDLAATRRTDTGSTANAKRHCRPLSKAQRPFPVLHRHVLPDPIRDCDCLSAR